MVEQMNLEDLKAVRASLVAERRAMNVRIEEVEQQILSLKATHKIGDTIEWCPYGRKTYRGVVRGYRPWCDGVAYGVQRLRKDGSPGASRVVYPHDKPRASSVAYTEPQA